MSDMTLLGQAALPPHETQVSEDVRRRLQTLGARIAQLQGDFSQNVVHAEATWSKDLLDQTRLGGLPLHDREAARQKAQSARVVGFRVTLERPMYDAVMRHVEDRELRRELYEAYTTRASDRGPHAERFDNGPLIDETLSLRHELANKLGFRSYADAVLRTGIARCADDAERLLLELNARVRPKGQEELGEVWNFAKSLDGIKGFRPWDLPYYVEKLANHRLGFSGPTASFVPAALARLREIELALFDLRVHRDYVPAGRTSKLRSHVLDTLAQTRREVNVLPPPPWDRSASSLVEVFGEGQVAGYYYARVLAQSDAR